MEITSAAGFVSIAVVMHGDRFFMRCGKDVDDELCCRTFVRNRGEEVEGVRLQRVSIFIKKNESERNRETDELIEEELMLLCLYI